MNSGERSQRAEVQLKGLTLLLSSRRTLKDATASTITCSFSTLSCFEFFWCEIKVEQ